MERSWRKNHGRESWNGDGCGPAPIRAEYFFGVLRRFWPCYVLALISIAVIKYRYSSVDVELLGWILEPTAWWAGILTGEPFPWQAGIGYVSVPCQFVIANTCSGIQFLMIVIAALVFGFAHRMGTVWKAMAWTAGSMVFSYGFTVFVNGVRIACAIFLPRRLPSGMLESFPGGLLTPDRLHTLIGIVVYFTSLLFIYEMAGAVLQRTGMAEGDITRAEGAVTKENEDAIKADGAVTEADRDATKEEGAVTKADGAVTEAERAVAKAEDAEQNQERGAAVQRPMGIWVPVFWYFFVVLGIPFLNRAYERRPEAFTEYAIMLGIVCTGVLAVYWVLKKLHFL